MIEMGEEVMMGTKGRSEEGYEIPYLVDDVKGRRPAPLDHHALRNSIERARFTPIIGAEVPVIDRESTESWQQMTKEMDRTLASLLELSEEANYFKSLRDQKKAKSLRVPEQKTKEERDQLYAFRKSLILLASKATRVFGDEMRYCAVCDAATYGIEVRNPTNLAVMNERLVAACLAALGQVRAALNSNSCRRTGLEEGDIYEQLLDLACKFMGGHIPSIEEEPFPAFSRSGIEEEVLREVQRDLQHRARTVTKDRKNRLFLHQLEWLADLVFHSFSFDGAFYLTDEELSFRAALHVPESDRRPPSVCAFEAYCPSPPALAKKVAEWFKKSQLKEEARSALMQEFHGALAQILFRQWKSQRKPVVFSMNLDLEMENALESCEVPHYCVAVPVEVTVRIESKSGGQEKRQQRWLLAKFEKEDKEKEYKLRWSWLSGRCGLESFGSEIKGPLVVKLRGSPLHPLPTLKSKEDLEKTKGRGTHAETQYIASPASKNVNLVYSSIDHFVMLSESSFLHNNVIIRNIPQLFTSIFKSDRDFYFLGLSTSEWHMHLQMSEVAFPEFVQGRQYYPPDRLLVAINEHFDEFRSSVLHEFGIKRWYGDLGQLARQLKKWVAQMKDEY